MRAPADVLELIQRRTPACEAVAEMLPSLADEDGRAKRRARAHVRQCLRCQAEVAAYRRMLRMMHSLRSDRRPPAPGTLAELLEALEAEGGDVPGLGGRWVLILGGALVTAAALGAAAVLAWTNRRPTTLWARGVGRPSWPASLFDRPGSVLELVAGR
jgi:hypothetical protein